MECDYTCYVITNFESKFDSKMNIIDTTLIYVFVFQIIILFCFLVMTVIFYRDKISLIKFKESYYNRKRD